MLWLAIHLPRLPLEVIEQTFIEDKAQSTPSTQTRHVESNPLVVLVNNRVHMRNAAAAELNVALNATLATAHSVAPDLTHAERAPELEQRRLGTLANTLYQFSSHVALQVPDCVLLEVSRSLKLFGSYQIIEKRVADRCQALGHQVVCRTAVTPWAAIALARGQTHNLDHVNLADAGLDLAGVDPGIIERFKNMGIYTLGPVMALPDKQLGRRFGKALLTYLKRLTGEIPDPRTAIEPMPDFTVSRHLLEPITKKADFYSTAYSPMKQLLQELQQWLITNQLGCEALRWQFSGKPSVALDIRFAQPRQNATDLLRITLLKLDRTELPGEVMSVSLHATLLQPWSNQSLGLFGTSEQTQSNIMQGTNTATPLTAEAFELMDEFRARLGEDACHGVQAQAQHAPESAWCPVQTHTQGSLVAAQQTPQQQRPLWLFETPYAVKRDELTLLHGPERIQSNWWQHTISRDYYIAQHRLGPQCWVYLDQYSDWFLHGYFA